MGFSLWPKAGLGTWYMWMMRPLLVLGVQVRQKWPENMVGDETTIDFGVFRFGFAFLFTVVSKI